MIEEEIDSEEEKVDPRAIRIMELSAAGYNQKEIAKELGVSTKTIQRYRQNPTYIDLLEKNRLRYDELMDEMSDTDITTIKIELLKEMGRQDRAGSKLMADAALRLHEGGLVPDPRICRRCVMAKRRNAAALLDAIKLTPKQKKVMEKWVAPEGAPYLLKDGSSGFHPDLGEAE